MGRDMYGWAPRKALPPDDTTLGTFTQFVPALRDVGGHDGRHDAPFGCTGPFFPYGGVIRRKRGRPRAASHVYAFAAGYLARMDNLQASLATILQSDRSRDGFLSSPMMDAKDARFGGAPLLIAAGLYQFTPFKRACLASCRHPVEFIVRHWRPGLWGGFYLGAAHGLYCLGCCWALMMLLFVGGVMNLWWIAALTLFVLLEKAAPFGEKGGRYSGLVVGFVGAWIVVKGFR